jgi:hypothetical protein
MVDRLGVRHSAGRRRRRGPERIGNPAARDPRQAPSETRSALAIIHAQYFRELARAASSGPGERARALAEARRLAKVAAALHGRGTDQDVDGTDAPAPAQPEPRDP